MLGGIWAEFRRALVASIGRPRARSGRRRRERYGISLRHEYLEARELLSVNTISFDAKSSQVVIRGTTDADNVVVTSNGAGSIHVRAESPDGVVEADFLEANISSIRFDGSSGDDYFENRTSMRVEAFGGAGNDTLIGGSGNDRILGQDGNDSLTGGLGDDDLEGGMGDDRIRGGEGNDEISGQEGRDWLYGDAGHDTLDGGVDDDKLLGGSGNDFLVGGSGNDELFGQEGNDRVLGQDGADYLDGGDDDDQVDGGLGNDFITGGDGNDDLSGQEGDDFINGGAGNDTVSGGVGNDKLLGGSGDDLLAGGDDDDQLFGQDGNDRLLGQNGNDYLQGDLGDDRLIGGIGNDLLSGGDGIDDLSGEDGNDRLYGGAGDDQLSGGVGVDVVLGGDGNDVLIGGDGEDFLYGQNDNDRLLGQNDDDYLDGGAGVDALLGGLGNDILLGREGNDDLSGEDGNDRVDGGEGDDVVSGGVGNDLVFGGDGADTLIGGTGDDFLYGDAGDDRIIAQEGNDLLFGGSGNDELLGGDGNNVLVGGSGNDNIDGGAFRDVLVGSEGADDLDGGGGDDILIGGSTVYDTDAIRLKQLLTAWSTTAPYAMRVASIQDELFAARLELRETVLDDAISDTIYGNGGEDWFVLTGELAVYDPNLDHLDDEQQEHDAPGHSHGPVVVGEIPALEGFALIDSLDKIADRTSSETLTTLIPHAEDSLLQREHLALFQLVRYDQVTHHAVRSGNWSDPTIWHDGVVPTDGARVLIPINVTVRVDGVFAARIATIRVDGTLAFATTVNTELKVDTVVVGGTGAFEMGTEVTPISAGVRARLLITDNGAIDPASDPFLIGRGLISHGRVTMHGAATLSSSTLLNPPMATAGYIRLDQIPLGWKVGDRIVIAGATAGTEQNELRTIRAINGPTVVLDRGLTYSHVPASPEFKIHVINLSRNAVIESESTATDRRGHVMFMHNRNVDIAYAGFYRLGRTDKLQPINDPVVDANWQLQEGTGTNARARYSVHFHRTGTIADGNPAVVRGSAVLDSPGWGFVNHSSYVDMIDNVAFAVRGAAFTTEVGDEVGSFVGNVAIGTSGSGEALESRRFIQDFGHQGDGFWFQGTGITVTNNVAAGNDGSAFAYFARSLTEAGIKRKFNSANLANPEIANGAPDIHVGEVPVLLFEDNIGYSSRIGLSVWYVMETAKHDLQSVFRDSQFWNNSNGAELQYTRRTTLENLRFIDSTATSSGIGVGMNTVTRDITYLGLTVIGYARGIVVPRSGYSIIEGGTFDNVRDIFVLSGLSSNRTVLITGLATLPRISMNAIYRDSDGSINSFFTPDSVILNFGPFVNQRVYYDLQHPDAIPFPKAAAGVPSDYIGLTSQQLWDQYGVAVSGSLAPANTITVPLISGGLILPTP
jgi:Ca2+-binding RTX toxin-like protein